MTFPDLAWHVAGFLLPAVGLGLIASALVALLWRQATRRIGRARLVGWSCLACLLASVAALVVTGRDGTTTGYIGMVLACAGAQAWLLRRA